MIERLCGFPRPLRRGPIEADPYGHYEKGNIRWFPRPLRRGPIEAVPCLPLDARANLVSTASTPWPH